MDNVAIVGGGIGGLAAALALIRRGIDVDVYEQAPELRELGAGVQISANGTRVLHALGLKEALEKVQVLPAGKAIRLWNTGQSWKLFDLGLESVERYGFPYITIHRGDLHGVIAQAVLQAKPGAIHLNRKCVGLSQTADHVELRFETGAPVKAKLVVGADGVHSVVRETLFGAAKPEFCGIIAWRGVIPMERVPASISRSIGTNWVGPGGHVVHYPLRAGKLLNFVGMGERDWTVEGWNVRGTTEEVLSDFRGWHADVHALIRNIDVPYKWGLALRPPMEQWSKGRCTLLGDACHPDGAAVGPRRSHGARGRLRAGARTRKISARSPSRTGRLRGGTPRPRQQGRRRLRRHDPALPQPRHGRRRGGAGPCRSRMAGGSHQGALRLVVHL